MIRAVVETNILIRALIKPRGTVGPMLTHLADGKFVIVYSEPMLDELIAKLVLPRIRTKYAIDDQTIETTIALSVAWRTRPADAARPSVPRRARRYAD